MEQSGQSARRARYLHVAQGAAVGAVGGAAAVAFRLALEGAEALRGLAGAYIAAHPWALALWLGLLAGAAGLAAALLRWQPFIGGSGIPQVEGELQGSLEQNWWQVLAAKFAGGVVCVGAGLSLGREGPSIQLGAMAGKGVGRLLGARAPSPALLLTCGASAGLSAAFNAPFAGVLFALEELHHTFSADVLLCAMSASVTADMVARLVCGGAPEFGLTAAGALPLSAYPLVALLGLALGGLGAFYNFCLGKSQDLYARISRPWLRLLIPFLLAGVLLAACPSILGGGRGLVLQAAAGPALGLALGLLAAKFLFSMASFGCGAPGGIFLPLLVLGALTGAACSAGLGALGLEAPAANFAMLGMAGLFAAIVRAPATGVILICEMNGSFTHLLSLTLVSLAAYAAADLLGARPVYDQLLDRLLAGRQRAETARKKQDL